MSQQSASPTDVQSAPDPVVDPRSITPALYKQPRVSEADSHVALREGLRKRGAFRGHSDVPRGQDGKFVSSAATPQPPESEESSPSEVAETKGKRAAEPRHAAQESEEQDAPTSKAQSREHHLARENKALREKAARLESERKALIDEQKKAKRERAEEAILSLKLPDGHEEWTEERRTAWIANQTVRTQVPPEDLDELRRGVLENRVLRTLKDDIDNDDQLAAVMSVLDSLPSLTPREALALAETRSPDLFIEEEPEPVEEAPAPPPPTHRVTEPSQSSRSRAPVSDPMKVWRQNLTSKDRRVREQAAHELLKQHNRSRGNFEIQK